MQELLEEIGLEGSRIKMINISSAMGGQFAASTEDMVTEIHKIGPNPLNVDGNDSSTED